MKELGVINENEKKAIEDIFNRKTALQQLLAIIPKEDNDLYEKLIRDYIETDKKMHKWWTDNSLLHGWVYDSQDGWQVDFSTNTVFLIEAKDKQKT